MKRKLLFLLTALCFGFVSGVKAVDWYTSGSEVAAGSDYYLYNIGAGKFLDNGMNWGTRATVDNSGQALTLAAGATDGTYTIKTNLQTTDGMGGGDWMNGGYMDGDLSVDFKLNPVPVDGYTNVYTLQVNSGGKYMVYADTDPAVNAVNDLTGTKNDYWLLIPKSARISANDYTFLMKNASMNTTWENHIWTAAGFFDSCNFGGGKTDNMCAEVYNGIFDFYQQIANVPNGKYTLTCQGFYRGTESTLYANGYTVAMKNITSESGPINWMTEASAAFTEGKYGNTLDFIVANGTIQIGIQKLTTAWADWNVLTNFKLTRTGDATTEEQNTAITTAHTWAVSRVTTAKEHFAMTAANRTALGTALTDYSSATADNVTALLAAYNTALYDGAGSGVTGLTSDIRDIIALDYDNDFKTYLYNHGSTINEGANVQACHSGFELAKIQTASSTDYTPMIRNAAVTVAKYGWGGEVIDHKSAPYTGAPDNFYLARTNDIYNVNQTVYGLPAGTYSVSAWTYASSAGYRKLYISNGKSDLIAPESSEQGWVQLSGTFTLSEKTNIMFGLWGAKIDKGETGFDNWTLTRTGDAKAISAAGWATYCSPYALDLEHATGLTDAYIVTGGKDGVLKKTSVKGGTVPANTGLLLKGDEGTATIPVVASSSTDVSANKLVGVTAETNIPANTGWVLMGSPSPLGFYQNTNAFTVGANTAYLPSNFDVSGARDFFRLEDDFTGINAIEAAEAKAEGLKDGKYLIGNKVVLVKNGVKYGTNGQKLN